MTDKDKMDGFLEDLFAEAQTDADAQVSDDFMARMLAEAEAYQPAALEPVATPQRSLSRALFDTLGGWQGASGLVAATMASVWVGFAGAESLSIDGLQAVLSGDFEFYLLDVGTEFSFELEEG